MAARGCDRLSQPRRWIRHAAVMKPGIELLLLDVDGVLLDYQRSVRVRHLAHRLGVDGTRVQQVLFESGLETRYDSGMTATAEYLRALSEGLQAEVSEALWIQARVAASRPREDVVQQILTLPAAVRIGVLTNNGPLMAEVLRALLPALCDRVGKGLLCSGALGGRKPDPALYQRALQHLQVTPSRTLFIDDLFTNVRGARQAGLHAETVRDGRSVGRVLKRHGLR
jgi:glucose-1-phosphatase